MFTQRPYNRAMHRLPPVRAHTGSARITALAMAGLLAACGVLIWLLMTWAPASPAVWLWMPWLGFGAACAAAGALWGRQAAAAQLRQERLQRQALSDLADTWLWQTNAAHELVLWRPPHTAPSTAWTNTAQPSGCLWQRFEACSQNPQAGALQARLDTHAPLSDLRVQQHDGAGCWRLRGQPLFDHRGEFSGYVGSALPMDASEQQRFDQALLSRLWPELDLALVALRPGPQANWCVAALSDAARQLMKLDGQDIRGMDWAAACALLPAELAASAAKLKADQSHTVGDWRLSLCSLGEGNSAGRLLMLLPPAAPEAVADTASAADQESFVYSVSHDLRAPIRVVEGFTRILKEDYGRFLDRIGNDHVDRVLAAAARMNSMIDALLSLSRLQSQPLTRKPVDLSQVASYIVEDLRSESPERQVSVTIEPGLLVNGDPTLLRIALDNLLGNAWKYSGRTAQAVISFHREEHDGKSVLVVSDNGAGFDMRFADRLFGLFQRLHSPKDFQGNGVGLASVRRIVRRHGGDIWAESEVGKGARFYFTLA
jgi:signal transduction histidine kinase